MDLLQMRFPISNQTVGIKISFFIYERTPLGVFFCRSRVRFSCIIRLNQKESRAMVLNFLKPTYCVNSVYDLSVDELKKHSIKAVLTDLDNTLLAWNNPNGTVELHEWLKETREAGIEVIVVSNNTWDRVKKAVGGLEVDYVAWSLKPLPRGILKVLHDRQLKKDEVVMVGDQMLTDVWAAHLAGVPSVLVERLIESDMWQTWINRFIENQAKKIIYKKDGVIFYDSLTDAIEAKKD